MIRRKYKTFEVTLRLEHDAIQSPPDPEVSPPNGLGLHHLSTPDVGQRHGIGFPFPRTPWLPTRSCSLFAKSLDSRRPSEPIGY